MDYQQIALSKETMFLFGIGYKNIILKRYPPRKRTSPSTVIDETVIKVGLEYI